MSNRWSGVLAVGAVTAGLYLIFGSGGDASKGAEPPAPRAQMPVVTLPRADGGRFSSGPLRGKSPLVISFFATW